jgi:hypothetical protein
MFDLAVFVEWTPDHAHPIWSAAVTPHAWEFGERWRSWLDSDRSELGLQQVEEPKSLQPRHQTQT